MTFLKYARGSLKMLPLGLVLTVACLVTCLSTAANANPCVKILADIQLQQDKITDALTGHLLSPFAPTTLPSKARAVFKSLPKAFLKKNFDVIVVYLLADKQIQDIEKGLFELDEVIDGRTDSDTAQQRQLRQRVADAKKSVTGTDIAFAKFHPNLLEIAAVFDVANVADDKINAAAKVSEIVEALKGLLPVEQQIAIRFAIDQIVGLKTGDVSAYSLQILFQAANELAEQIDPSQVSQDERAYARELASGLSQLITLKGKIAYNTPLAVKQVSTVLSRYLDGQRMSTKDALAAFKTTLTSMTWTSTTNYGLWWLLFTAGLSTVASTTYNVYTANEFSPASHYTDSNLALVSMAAFLGLRFTLTYLQLVSTKNYAIRPSGRYLRQDPLQYRRNGVKLDIVHDEFNKLENHVSGVVAILERPAPTPTPHTPRASSLGAFSRLLQQIASPPTVATATEPEDAEPEPASPTVEPTPAPQPQPAPANVPPKPADVAAVRTQLAEVEIEKTQPREVSPELRESGHRFAEFFAEIKKRIVERDRFTDLMMTSYLMPKTANLLVVSEPGVGKTTNTKFIMKAIKDRDGQPSVFTIQMGKDTTIDDLMGPVKPSEIQNDRIVRAVENGLPGKKQAFFDEYFRAPIYTREGVLEYQANGTVSLGGVTYDSENILSVYASNMYPTQVFYRDGKDARAEIDRMLFTFVLLPTYESDENMVTDVEPSSEGLSQLYFDDIALLKDAAKKIVVPRYFRSKLKVLVNKLRAKAMIDEHESEVAWQRKMQEGHILLTSPEYNTRVLSPRSEGLAQLLLGRFAFRDWLNEGMPEDRLPEVTEKHFAELEDFFAPVSNSDEAIHRVLQQYADGSAQHQQFNLILKRRKEFASTSQQIERDVNRNTDIIQLENFAAHLKFTRKSFYGPSLVAADGQPFTLDADNATIVAEFLKWHKDLLRRSQQRGQIVEMQAQDVAMDKAVHYANRLLAFIKPSRE